MVRKLGAIYYVDSQSQDVVEELVKFGNSNQNGVVIEGTDGVKVILVTAPSGKAMSEVLGGLSVNGKLIVIGASDESIEVSPNLMIGGRRSTIGWPSGTSIDSQDTLSFSLQSDVKSINQVFPLEHAPEAFELVKVHERRERGSNPK